MLALIINNSIELCSFIRLRDNEEREYFDITNSERQSLLNKRKEKKKRRKESKNCFVNFLKSMNPTTSNNLIMNESITGKRKNDELDSYSTKKQKR